MNQILTELTIQTKGQGFIKLDNKIKQWISNNNLWKGMLLISVKHTSCSLTINENADPHVLKDLSAYMKAIVPEEGFKPISGEGGLRKYLHAEEGKDDMPAHIRTSLTSNSISLSIDSRELVLGIWQAIYLWEHRSSSNLRIVSLHFIGEVKT